MQGESGVFRVACVEPSLICGQQAYKLEVLLRTLPPVWKAGTFNHQGMVNYRVSKMAPHAPTDT